MTRGLARLYLLVNQPYRCADCTRLPALFQARFKERERVKTWQCKKGVLKVARVRSGSGALPRGINNSVKNVVMGTMLVTHMIKLNYDTIFVT